MLEAGRSGGSQDLEEHYKSWTELIIISNFALRRVLACGLGSSSGDAGFASVEEGSWC